MEEIRYVLQGKDGRFFKGKDYDSGKLEWTGSTKDAIWYWAASVAKQVLSALNLEEVAVKKITITIEPIEVLK